MIENHRADKVRRKKVGGELNALELRVYGRRERFYGESLGEARHPLQQNMTPAEQPDEEPLHHVLLPNDNPVDLFDEPADESAFAPHPLVNFLNMGGKLHSQPLD